jgi:DNA replication and repair protein RecF
MKGKDFASINALIEEGDIKRKIKVILTPAGKRILISEKPVIKLSELSERVDVIIFEPRDAMLFDDLPKTRRKFLDVSLSKHTNGYLDHLGQYEKALKERNELLKQENPNRDQLLILTGMLATLCEPIVRLRAAYLKSINEVISKIVTTIKGVEMNVELIYDPFITPGDNFISRAKDALEKALENDIRRKVTSLGPHREDFHATLKTHDIASFGSQGENRLLAIALKLSPYFLITDKDKRPIVVLDDVLSELDNPTQARLLPFLEKFDQVFITTTKNVNCHATIYDVADHKIIRRNGHGK